MQHNERLHQILWNFNLDESHVNDNIFHVMSEVTPPMRPYIRRNGLNAGLKNIGKNCYSNAILQVIASCSFLPDCLLKPPSQDHTSYGLYFQFATVISSIIKGNSLSVDPSPFVDKINLLNPSFCIDECELSCTFSTVSFIYIIID